MFLRKVVGHPGRLCAHFCAVLHAFYRHCSDLCPLHQCLRMAGSTSIRRFFHCNSLCGGGKLAELQFQRGEPGAGFGVVSCGALCRHRHIVVHSSLLLYILYRVQVRKALPVEVQEDFVLVPRMPPGSPRSPHRPGLRCQRPRPPARHRLRLSNGAVLLITEN